MRISARGRARDLVSRVAGLLLPPACSGCGEPLPAGGPSRWICGLCRSRLREPPRPRCPRCGYPRGTARPPEGPCAECAEWPPSLRSARSAVVLAPPADALVHRLKYGGWRSLAPTLARRMASVPLPRDVRDEARIVVPVPTTRKRRRRRGYDQAEVLADAYAGIRGLRVVRALARRRASGSQVVLQPAQRRANVAGAFGPAAGPAPELRDAHVLLVDDVLTTGATALEATRALVTRGCRLVSVITFARSLPVPGGGGRGDRNRC